MIFRVSKFECFDCFDCFLAFHSSIIHIQRAFDRMHTEIPFKEIPVVYNGIDLCVCISERICAGTVATVGSNMTAMPVGVLYDIHFLFHFQATNHDVLLLFLLKIKSSSDFVYCPWYVGYIPMNWN